MLHSTQIFFRTCKYYTWGSFCCIIIIALDSVVCGVHCAHTHTRTHTCTHTHTHTRTHPCTYAHTHIRWKEQESYIDSLLSMLESSSASEVAKLKDSESKLQLQVQELTKRELDLKVHSTPTFILYISYSGKFLRGPIFVISQMIP